MDFTGPVIFLLVVMFFYGSLLGSYFITVYTRKKAGQKIKKVPSHCLECGTILRARKGELLPIFTYLIRQGKCKYCGAKIGVSTLLSEIVGGVVVLGICFGMLSIGPEVLRWGSLGLGTSGLVVERFFLRIS